MVQINCSFLLEQKQARTALIKIISSLKCLAVQGLAIQGRNSDDGNFYELLNFRAEDIAGLHSWLTRKHSYSSHPIQNDILRIMCHMVLRKIIKEVNDQSINFGIVVDGTQDIQGKEQQCICVRYVTDAFQIKKEFLDLYNIESTSGLSISAMLLDVLIRLQIPIENLRSQTYDGTANMTGKFYSCQAEIKKTSDISSFCKLWCSCHTDSSVQSILKSYTVVIKDALDHIDELNKLYTQSGKFKNLYLTQHGDAVETPQPSSLKPIYSTRWLTRLFAVKCVLQNYSYVLDALKQWSPNFLSKGPCKGLFGPPRAKERLKKTKDFTLIRCLILLFFSQNHSDL